MHIHPDMRTALAELGQESPSPPQSGIGEDPRRSYEDAYWTDDEKTGHRAYVQSVQNDSVERETVNQMAGKVSIMQDVWTNKQGMEPPNPLNDASAESEWRKGSVSERIKALQKDVEGIEKAELEAKRGPLRQDEGFRATSESLSRHGPVRQLERNSRLSNQGNSEGLPMNAKDLESMKADGNSDIVGPGPQLIYPTKNRARRPVKIRLSSISKDV
jgi:hypothetical protein